MSAKLIHYALCSCCLRAGVYHKPALFAMQIALCNANETEQTSTDRTPCILDTSIKTTARMMGLAPVLPKVFQPHPMNFVFAIVERKGLRIRSLWYLLMSRRCDCQPFWHGQNSVVTWLITNNIFTNFDWYTVVCSGSTTHKNQSRLIVKWPTRNKLGWKPNQS